MGAEVGSLARDYLRAAASREAICRAFRLGLSLGGDALGRKAREKGFTREELTAAGLMRRARRRLLPAPADVPARRCARPRRRLPGAKLHEDDPLRGKYVNTQESELFHKSAVVYGLDKARSAIAKQDRACVVEGNTDVIALRQSGFEPVVACMGTALTEQQLRSSAGLRRGSGSHSTATRPESRRRSVGWSSRSRRDST